jgi:TonB-dependent receptor
MSERYNNVQLNGTSMPSTEPNRRNFSFDIIPSALVDNVTVAKTFTPDMQGEFTGGMVEISTLAVPKKNFFNLTLGTGMNTNSTGKEFKSNTRFSSDYLLGNASERNWYGRDWISSEYASYFKTDGTGVLAPEYAEKAYAMNAKIPNHWGLTSFTAAPLQNYALSMGKSIDLGGGNTLGATVAATYRHEENVETVEEAMYRSGPTQTRNAHNYKFTTAAGVVANIGWERPGHKITLRNLFNNRFTHENIERVLFNRYTAVCSLEQYSSPMRNTLWQTQLEGEHRLPGIILTWFADYNNVVRSQPEDRLKKGNLRVSGDYTQPFSYFPDIPLVDGKHWANWAIFNSTRNDFGEGHIMNSKLNETKKNAGGNLEFPFIVAGNVQKLKTGYWGTFRNASYTQQFITMYKGANSATGSDLSGLSLHEALAPENFANGSLVYTIGALGDKGDYYNGKQTIHATYLMGDFSFFQKLHLTGGVRMEAANTELFTRYRGYSTTRQFDSTIVRTKTDWLPALTLIYNITDKINIRGAVSKTLARPDFRELTRYKYYNANDRSEVGSNQPLVTTYTDNYDLRLEYYPQSGELLSISAFYKYFTNPVEMLCGGLNRDYSLMPANLDNASIKGVELNVRKSFGFIAPAGFLKDLYLTANATLLQGEVKYNFDKIVDIAQGLDPKDFSGTDRKRPLQGMAPYAVNAGLDYQTGQLGLALNYGRIGRKIVMAGGKESEDTYEAPRDVIDFQISYRLLGGRMQIKANASDLLNQPVILYDNSRESSVVADPDKDYNKGEDILRSKVRKGTNYSLSVSYNF